MIGETMGLIRERHYQQNLTLTDYMVGIGRAGMRTVRSRIGAHIRPRLKERVQERVHNIGQGINC